MPLPLLNIEIRITGSRSGKGGKIGMAAPHLNMILADNGVPAALRPPPFQIL